MIDWFSGFVPLQHSEDLNGGYITDTDQHGVLKWKKAKFQKCEGSFSDVVSIRSDHSSGMNSHIYVHGNLVKFFQGHNLFGSNDLEGLLKHFITELVQKGHISPLVSDPLGDIQNTRITRLDLTEGFRLKDSDEVNSWLQGAEQNTTMKYRGRGVFTRGTLYYGKHSQMWALKLYNKHAELIANKRKHKKASQKLIDYSDGILRAEIVLRTKELARIVNQPFMLLKHYNLEFYKNTYANYAQKLEIGKMESKDVQKLEELKPSEQATYEMFRNGMDIQGILSRATFYRHKKAILEKTGVNIASNNIVSIARKLPEIEFITARAEQVPEEFLNSDLYFDPSQKPQLKLVSNG